MDLCRRLSNENPHIAAWHFHSRAQVFQNVVLKEKFNMVDFWSWCGCCLGMASPHRHYCSNSEAAREKGGPEPKPECTYARMQR